MIFDFDNEYITSDTTFIPVFMIDNVRTCPTNDFVTESSINTTKTTKCQDGYTGDILWTCQSNGEWKKEDNCKVLEQKTKTEDNSIPTEYFIYGGIGLAAVALIIFAIM